jgi:vancomycin resistance protein YoaR
MSEVQRRSTKRAVNKPSIAPRGAASRSSMRATNRAANEASYSRSTARDSKVVSIKGAGTRRKTSKKRSSKRKTANRRAIRQKSARLILALIVVLIVGWIFRNPITSKICEIKLSMPTERGENTIKKGVLIGGEDYSGMNLESAMAAVEKRYPKQPEQTEKSVIIKSTDERFSREYTMQDFDIGYDLENAVNRAVNFGWDESSDSWLREFKALESGTVDIPVITYNREKVASIVRAIVKEVSVDAKNASEKRVNGKFVITESQTGYSMNYDEVFNAVVANFENGDFGEEVVFDITVTEPTVYTNEFDGADKLIGKYATTYTLGDDNRIQNLRNACEKINGVIVYPNEEFSTNEHFAPFTEANGWANAGTIVNGQIEDSLGGGMCQVSSVLYDALLKAELCITERFNHSMKVGYSPYAFDATLAGDYKDLKFKNDTSKPVYIEAYLANNSVNVNLYGEEIHDSGRTVELENKYIESFSPEEPITKNDPDMYEGETKVVKPLDGQVYELYRKIYENGVLKSTEKINTSKYSARRQVTYIGTKKKETATQQQT